MHPTMPQERTMIDMHPDIHLDMARLRHEELTSLVSHHTSDALAARRPRRRRFRRSDDLAARRTA